MASCLRGYRNNTRKGKDGDEAAQGKTSRAVSFQEAGSVQASVDRSYGSGGFGGRRDSDRRLSDRSSGHPGTRCEARQDPAPRHRRTRGRPAARKGARRRAGANSTPRRIGRAFVNGEVWNSRESARRGSSHPRLGRYSHRRGGGSPLDAPGYPPPAYHYQQCTHEHCSRGVISDCRGDHDAQRPH
jgi:hypothetical protein